MKANFAGVGKGWFNMKETSKITYDFGKLKRFLTVVRLMMQDTVLSLVKRNYSRFAVFLRSFLPDRVVIADPSDIRNEYSSDARQAVLFREWDLTFRPKARVPLFTLEMLKTQNDEEFIYSTPPLAFVKMVVMLLEKALDEIAKVPDLEPKILQDLYKSQKNESYIKTPLKPKERPMTPNPAERPRKYPDENKWLWDVIEDLRDRLLEGIEPLERYMAAFNKFKAVLHMNPDDEARRIEMDE
jgi:dynein heavy chain